jgi:hypothetical protein
VHRSQKKLSYYSYLSSIYLFIKVKNKKLKMPKLIVLLESTKNLELSKFISGNKSINAAAKLG